MARRAHLAVHDVAAANAVGGRVTHTHGGVRGGREARCGMGTHAEASKVEKGPVWSHGYAAGSTWSSLVWARPNRPAASATVPVPLSASNTTWGRRWTHTRRHGEVRAGDGGNGAAGAGGISTPCTRPTARARGRKGPAHVSNRERDRSPNNPTGNKEANRRCPVGERPAVRPHACTGSTCVRAQGGAGREGRTGQGANADLATQHHTSGRGGVLG